MNDVQTSISDLLRTMAELALMGTPEALEALGLVAAVVFGAAGVEL